jgi:hypothetical protein
MFERGGRKSGRMVTPASEHPNQSSKYCSDAEGCTEIKHCLQSQIGNLFDEAPKEELGKPCQASHVSRGNGEESTSQSYSHQGLRAHIAYRQMIRDPPREGHSRQPSYENSIHEIHCNKHTEVKCGQADGGCQNTRRRLRQPASQVTRPWKLPSAGVRLWRLRCGSPSCRPHACRGWSWSA